MASNNFTGAPEATRTPDTGIRKPKQAILANMGKALLIEAFPFSDGDFPRFGCFDFVSFD
jgi:hypothetical protein